MTPRELFIHALQRKEPIKGTRVPTFELVYFLTMESFGKVHPGHRRYAQWDQMKKAEQELHLMDMARLYVDTARKFDHNAIFIHETPGGLEGIAKVVENIRKLSGNDYFTMIHGDATFGLPDGDSMLDFVYWLADDPNNVHADAQKNVNVAIANAEYLKKNSSLDGFALCSDYCLNVGPFLSPDQFGEFVTPYLAKLIKAYRDMGFYTIKHTDGNIMPIIDQLVQAKPDALHSLDPQGHVDIKEVKAKYGKDVTLIGNVNCGLLTTGTDAEVIASAEYCLTHAKPGGGYIFSTSNCVFTGMELKRYELILDVLKRLGTY